MKNRAKRSKRMSGEFWNSIDFRCLLLWFLGIKEKRLETKVIADFAAVVEVARRGRERGGED
jgi:hypothetical protein